MLQAGRSLLRCVELIREHPYVFPADAVAETAPVHFKSHPPSKSLPKVATGVVVLREELDMLIPFLVKGFQRAPSVLWGWRGGEGRDKEAGWE